MSLFSQQNDLNNALKWSKENRLEYNNAKFEAICFDVKELDQSSVHLYADDTQKKCKSSLNDLGIIITNNLKWDSHLMSGYQRHNETFFLEDKRSLFYKNKSKSKFIQKLHFIDSPLRVKCMVLESAKQQKNRKDAKTSAQVGFEQEILYQ